MKSIYLTIPAVCMLIFSCTSNQEETPSGEQNQASSEPALQPGGTLQVIYASVDSTFVIGGETFAVSVDQLDLTEQAYAAGDTLERPTYACIMEIFSGTGELLFEDSLTRDSWGYPGKIEAIDAYQITMPELIFKDNEIVASYRVYELNSMDAILGSVAFDIESHEARFYWEESFLE